jgi:hypothetical protein
MLLCVIVYVVAVHPPEKLSLQAAVSIVENDAILVPAV